MLKVKFRFYFSTLSLLLFLAWGFPAEAMSIFWAGGDGFWDTASNWEGGAVPQSEDIVYVTQGSAGDAGATTVTYRSSSTPALELLRVESRGAESVSLNLGTGGSGDELKTEALWNRASIVQDGAILTTDMFYAQQNPSFSQDSTYELKSGGIASRTQILFDGASFVQSGGTNSLSGSLMLHAAAGIGGYRLSGGSLEAQGESLGTASASSAALLIQSGGTNRVSNSLLIGDVLGSKGTYSLSGPGQLQAKKTIVGDDGDGEFIQTGGQHFVDEELIVALQPGTSGQYTLADGSVTAPTVRVGNGGDGRFIQSGGNSIVSEVLYLAGDGDKDNTSTGKGTYLLSGGSLTSTKEQIGFTHFGSMQQSAGVNTTDVLVLGGTERGAGEYLLSGGRLEGRIILGNDGGSGSFEQTGGEVNADTLWLGARSSAQNPYGKGSYKLAGGFLDSIDVQLLAADSSFEFVSGRLSFARTFKGDLLNQGGTLAPGNLLPSWTQSNPAQVVGNYTQQADAVLEIELGGPTISGAGYDQLVVTGNVWLDGLLELVLDSDLDLQAGDVFDILSADNIFGQFSALSLPDLSVAGLAFDINYLHDDATTNRDLVRLSVVENAPAPVPEPSTLVLLGLALIGLFGYCRTVRHD